MNKKILFDTDIGTDIDDAVCLAYLLKQQNCDLLGITTVSGESDKRAMLASVLCKVAKKNIPIYPGLEIPIFGQQRQSNAPQANALKNWEHETNFPKGEAIEFMRQTIRKNPGEVTLLAVGQFTNVATLFKVDPEIPSLLKDLVIMGGVFTPEYIAKRNLRAEWNAVCDPYATSIIYNSPVKIHKSIGLDVTMQVVMDKQDVFNNFKADILKPVVDFAGVWFENYEKIGFNDPLAGAIIFDECICEFERGNVEIELESPRLKGTTYWTPDKENGGHNVALGVNKNLFFEHYFDTVNK